jgi:hypothetical protein
MPAKLKGLKAGDQLKVPNVEPFELASVKDIKPGSETVSQAANEVKINRKPQAPTSWRKRSSKKCSRKGRHENKHARSFRRGEANRRVSCYDRLRDNTSPIGEWKVRGISKLPTFRYDKEMLEHGERSGNFHMLPPGPRNPVGVMWISLNKKGIGIHGTNDPDSIGRAASHGCIRLANGTWSGLPQKSKRVITSQFTELR